TSFSLARFRALTLDPAQAGPFLPIQFAGKEFHGLVAAHGFAWTVIDDTVHRFSADGEDLRFPLSVGPAPRIFDAVALALSPSGHVWVSVSEKGGSSLLKLTRNLKLVN